MAETGAATAALARAEADTATATYALWVDRASARDTAVARRRWRAVLAERGYVQVGEPTLVRTEGGEFYLSGGVRPA